MAVHSTPPADIRSTTSIAFARSTFTPSARPRDRVKCGASRDVGAAELTTSVRRQRSSFLTPLPEMVLRTARHLSTHARPTHDGRPPGGGNNFFSAARNLQQFARARATAGVLARRPRQQRCGLPTCVTCCMALTSVQRTPPDWRSAQCDPPASGRRTVRLRTAIRGRLKTLELLTLVRSA